MSRLNGWGCSMRTRNGILLAVHGHRAGFVAALVTVITVTVNSPVRAADGSEPVASTQVASTNVTLATELLGLSNISPILTGWRETLVQSADLGGPELDKEMRARFAACWRNAVLKSFDTRQSEQKLARLFAESLNARELKELIALRQTPLGEKISSSEQSFYARAKDTEKSMAWMIEAASRLEQDPNRKVLIEAITELSGGTKALTDALTNISVGATLGAESIKPPGQPRNSPEEIVAMVEQQGEQVWQHLDAVITTQYEMMYEKLNLKDLATLKAFLESRLGRRHTKVSLDAFNRLMRDEALAISARFANEWRSQDL